MKRCAIAIFIAQLLVGGARADSQVFALGEIRVSATSVNEDSLGSVSLDADEIRQNDRYTVGEALDLVPGITLSKQGRRNEQMIWMRGFNLRQVPVFLDGIPIYVPYDGYVDFGRFSTYDLSRIEVAKGFSSALYGANTLGGAINLISRRPSKVFEGEFGGSMSFTSRGEFNGHQLYTNVGTNQGMWYLQAGASYANQDFYRLPDNFLPSAAENGGRRENSSYHDGKINLKLGLTPNATDEYAINYINQQGVKDAPPYAGNAPANESPAYWRWPQWDKESLYFLSSTRIAEHTLKLRVYHDSFKNSLASYDDANYSTMKKSTSSRSYYDDYTNGFSIQGDLRLSVDNLLRTSYNIKHDIHRENSQGEPVRRFEDLTQTLALEDTHAITAKLSLVGGISFEERKSLEAQDYNSTTRKLSDFARADNSATNGQLGLNYELNNSDALYASVASKSRFPTIKDRYSYRRGRGLPNPELKTEEAIHYEIGYNGRLGERWMVKAAIFHSDITNLIQSNTLNRNCGPAKCLQTQNIGKAQSRGIELGIAGSLARWDFNAHYAYLERENLFNSDKMTDTPRHKVFANAIWHAGHGWMITGTTEAYSRRYSSSDGVQVADGFAVAHLKVGYRLTGSTLVEFRVHNLFDKLYAYVEGYPEMGRTYFVQFNTPFGG
ncbi:TonB-dependent receptor plug domain-containing protein [Dechloromonas sp. ARDL1]|uniref:TonB-dependent receptor plug domain-containing protein n=1 Tax=Dechloromonas sp. ARDL1 TaxID=3322121 RepID=UPI003DA74DAD